MRTRRIVLAVVVALMVVGLDESAALAQSGSSGIGGSEPPPATSVGVTAQTGGSGGNPGQPPSGSHGGSGSSGASTGGGGSGIGPGGCIIINGVGGVDACTAPPPGGPAGAALPDPAVLALAAREELPIVMPGPQTSPARGGFQLVAIETWMYMNQADWHPVSATATAGPVSTTVTATPETMTWDMGDGTSPVVCAGPGAPYSKGQRASCGHTYIESGEYAVTVTVSWTVVWVASTGGGGLQADIQLSDTFPITVRQGQAITD